MRNNIFLSLLATALVACAVPDAAPESDDNEAAVGQSGTINVTSITWDGIKMTWNGRHYAGQRPQSWAYECYNATLDGKKIVNGKVSAAAGNNSRRVQCMLTEVSPHCPHATAAGSSNVNVAVGGTASASFTVAKSHDWLFGSCP